MTKPIRFEKNAAAEYRDAEARYEGERDGLGAEFADAIDAALQQVLEMPRSGAPIRSRSGATIRRILAKRFPYYVVYEDATEAIRVLAIAHTSRDEGYWFGRI